ncbi:hypothetical protein Pelo_4236 [Pelomyxa schiedti]|nr:hypothetical protein Pelo_4236 [Pelomyxa schiedti]
MPDPEIASDAARVFVAAKREGGHIPVPGFPYTCGYGRGIKITERFHGKFLGWCLLSFRFTPARETDIQHFISSFLQIWISSQRYDLRLCTGWRWQEINVKHIVLSSEGFVKGISLDHESIGEDPDMEIVCSPENHRRLDRCLSRRIPGFESRLISNLRDIPGHGGVSRLSLHHQRITNLNQMLHTAAPAPSPSTGSASSAS